MMRDNDLNKKSDFLEKGQDPLDQEFSLFIRWGDKERGNSQALKAPSHLKKSILAAVKPSLFQRISGFFSQKPSYIAAPAVGIALILLAFFAQIVPYYPFADPEDIYQYPVDSDKNNTFLAHDNMGEIPDNGNSEEAKMGKNGPLFTASILSGEGWLINKENEENIEINDNFSNLFMEKKSGDINSKNITASIRDKAAIYAGNMIKTGSLSNLILSGQGHTIALKSNTEIFLESENRMILRKGAATFDIMPNQGSFSVDAGSATVLVLGTLFDISLNSDKTAQISLIRGRLQVISDNSSVLLYPGLSTRVDYLKKPLIPFSSENLNGNNQNIQDITNNFTTNTKNPESQDHMPLYRLVPPPKIPYQQGLDRIKQKLVEMEISPDNDN